MTNHGGNALPNHPARTTPLGAETKVRPSFAPTTPYRLQPAVRAR